MNSIRIKGIVFSLSVIVISICILVCCYSILHQILTNNPNNAKSNLIWFHVIFFTATSLIIIINYSFLLIFLHKYTKSIIKLSHLCSQGANGDLTIRFHSNSKDEIGELGASFNQMMDKIKTLTHFDPLTTLPNPYVLEKELDSLIYSCNCTNFSIIMVAIDRLSLINQLYGYKTGDAIICEVAERIMNVIHDNDQFYRYKGNEFIILDKDTRSESEIDEKAKNILKALCEDYEAEDNTIQISINIGCFIRNEDTRSEDPLKAVTQSMNYAKHLGSNQIQKFNHETFQKMHYMNDLQADIIVGLQQDQFFLVYQPLFYLHNGKIAEIEALIRWEHPKKGLLYPDQFIELAEVTGKITSIDYWVLEAACKQLKNWNNNIDSVLLSVNISAMTFESIDFIADLKRLLNNYDINPAFLQLEITERMIIKNIEESIQKFTELRTMGIHIAIDDFGIGYSSLNYIVRLPIDSIKIDKSFTKDITSSREAEAIVASIINICKSLELNVIAEGIENRTIYDYLKCRECDIGQGYYFSKPISIHEIELAYLINTIAD